jgi:hypothetical protein
MYKTDWKSEAGGNCPQFQKLRGAIVSAYAAT